jgi:hypothetical protein
MDKGVDVARIRRALQGKKLVGFNSIRGEGAQNARLAGSKAGTVKQGVTKTGGVKVGATKLGLIKR